LEQDLIVLGETLQLVLAKNPFSIDPHVEDSVLTPNECRVDAEALPDGGRQTGGPGQVVSRHAIGDGDLHRGDSPVRRAAGLGTREGAQHQLLSSLRTGPS